MDVNSGDSLGETSRTSLVPDTPFMGICALCHKTLSSDDEPGDHETLILCGDCKFLLLEDLEITSPDVYRRRRPVSRRRYNSSESTESIFSQQFSRMISQARTNHSMISDTDHQSFDGDSVARSIRRASSRTTPDGSRRWRRVLSDTESDGVDSLYGESESNVSFRRYRQSNGGETDTISYVEDSDDDGHSLLEIGNFEGSDVDSDTDIDPMNAGVYHWDSDNLEDDEYDSEWEIADIEVSTIETFRAGTRNHDSLRSNGSNDVYANWQRDFLSPEVEHPFLIRTRGVIQTHSNNLMTDLDESEVLARVGESGDYLDSRGFQNLLDRLAETENLTRGAPPTSVSFVHNLPIITITKDHDKTDNLACAICKDSLTVGTRVNQLPCRHMYHPSCILPWLSSRNTCPLCRYELPTDDKDYEERKRRNENRYETFQINQRVNDDNSLINAPHNVPNAPIQEPASEDEDSTSENNNARERPRNRWFFLAAPIVSIFGISLMLWLGNGSSSSRRYQSDRVSYRKEPGQRRWWPLL